MGRRQTREAALVTLFEISFHDGDPSGRIDTAIGREEVPDKELSYFRTLVEGVLRHADELDGVFGPFLKGWTLDRLPRTDRILLRMAVYEMLHMPGIPASVSINEAVELARRYGGDESFSYINAVLGRVAALQPEKDPEQVDGS